MNNLRLTIALFIFAAALAPALLVSWHGGQDARQSQAAPMPAAPVVPPGFKTAPWEGASTKRINDPPAAAPSPKSESDSPASSTPANPKSPAAASPVIVELFTSEGCSSCPAAEKLLNELAAAQPADSTTFFLAFHVDYWDRLGWKDRFASPANSERQRQYAKAFDTATVYTPQAIVNGEIGFVGSDKTKALGQIAEAQSRPASLTLSATHAAMKPGETLKVECVLKSMGDQAIPAGLVLCAAIVENGLSTAVNRGENNGRTLKHDRVVRAFASVSHDARAAAPAALELKPPQDLDPARMSVVVFAQDPASMKVHAAARATIAEPSPTR
ncbi:MAG: DUF1223 domain-containing protein [Phycisphaerales bacterium]|nr:DUF1223 domain-containing protein [Phycisphaerales bacterium]